MSAREIPHSQWPTVLGDFALRHFGWNVTLERIASVGGIPLVTNQSYLEELRANGAGDRPQITIVLGYPFDAFQTHVVPQPQRLRVAAGRLQIDSADGSRVVVRVRQPGRSA